MLICSFCKKISSVNSQRSKEINFEILFRNLERVLFSEIVRKKFQLWSAVIGQSASVYKHRMKRRRRCLSKVYFQCESAYFRKKNFEIFISKNNFEMTFQRDMGLTSVRVCYDAVCSVRQ